MKNPFKKGGLAVTDVHAAKKVVQAARKFLRVLEGSEEALDVVIAAQGELADLKTEADAVVAANAVLHERQKQLERETEGVSEMLATLTEETNEAKRAHEEYVGALATEMRTLDAELNVHEEDHEVFIATMVEEEAVLQGRIDELKAEEARIEGIVARFQEVSKDAEAKSAE